MNCPVDNTTLLITDRSGIEIDYCPNCRGVWLDRGELDKLIQGSESSSSYEHHDTRHYEEKDHKRPQHDNEHRGDHHKQHKKESFLGDIFDF